MPSSVFASHVPSRCRRQICKEAVSAQPPLLSFHVAAQGLADQPSLVLGQLHNTADADQSGVLAERTMEVLCILGHMGLGWGTASTRLGGACFPWCIALRWASSVTCESRDSVYVQKTFVCVCHPCTPYIQPSACILQLFISLSLTHTERVLFLQERRCARVERCWERRRG